jgi:hypothetical protein
MYSAGLRIDFFPSFLQRAQHVPPCFPVPRHVIFSSNDYDVHLPLWGKLLLASSFNDHVIHHLFPTVDLSKQYLVRPVLEKYCVDEKVGGSGRLEARLASPAVSVMRDHTHSASHTANPSVDSLQAFYVLRAAHVDGPPPHEAQSGRGHVHPPTQAPGVRSSKQGIKYHLSCFRVGGVLDGVGVPCPAV